MSVRLTGKDFTITVPGAEIVCDGPCGRAWPYDPNIVFFQQSDDWRGSHDHYAVSLRHCVGAPMPTAIDDKHLCVDCKFNLFKKAP